MLCKEKTGLSGVHAFWSVTPLPSAARVHPASVPARTPRGTKDSRDDLTPSRMAWHFVSAGAHALHSDQTLGPTPTRGHSALRLALSLPPFPVLLLGSQIQTGPLVIVKPRQFDRGK